MKKIRVRTVESGRDGVCFRWTDHAGKACQRAHEGKRTRTAIGDARRELQDELNRVGSRLLWSAFKARARRLYYDNLGEAAQNKAETMFRKFDAVHPTDFPCADLSAAMLLDVEESLAGLSPSSIHSYMQQMWAIINWGIDYELLPAIRRPRRRRSKQTKRVQKSGGRSLTGEEIDRMVQAVRDNPLIQLTIQPQIKSKLRDARLLNPGEDPDSFIRAIHACRLIGLRLDDCHRLRWEPAPGCHFVSNLNGRTPVVVFADEQKSGEAEEIPLTPPAVEWLRQVPADLEWICRARGKRGFHRTSNRLGRVIAGAGRAAGILTKPGKKPKYASAHDLRRTFATEWLGKLNVKEVQKLTRHANVQTLLLYYADCQVPALAAKLRETVEA